MGRPAVACRAGSCRFQRFGRRICKVIVHSSASTSRPCSTTFAPSLSLTSRLERKTSPSLADCSEAKSCSRLAIFSLEDRPPKTYPLRCSNKRRPFSNFVGSIFAGVSNSCEWSGGDHDVYQDSSFRDTGIYLNDWAGTGPFTRISIRRRISIPRV